MAGRMNGPVGNTATVPLVAVALIKLRRVKKLDNLCHLNCFKPDEQMQGDCNLFGKFSYHPAMLNQRHGS